MKNYNGFLYCPKCMKIKQWLSEKEYKITNCDSCQSALKMMSDASITNGRLCFKNKYRGELEIPEGVQEIGYMSEALITSLIIPKSVKTVECCCFSNCTHLKNVVIEGSPTFGSLSFYECNALKSISLKGALSKLPADLFDSSWDSILDNVSAFNVRHLDTHELPPAKIIQIQKINNVSNDYVKGYYRYKHYPQNTEITIGTVDTIKSCAFQNYPGLTKLTIDSVKTIENDAFKGCSSLTSVIIQTECAELSGFKNCVNLETIVIPEGTQIIGDEAFAGCTNLKSVALPSTIVEIGEKAFLGCDSLPQLHIPSSVSKIGKDAFSGVSFVWDIVPSSIDEKSTMVIPAGTRIVSASLASEYENATKIIIPDSVTEIKPIAFFNFINVTNIIFGNNVSKIGSLAFANAKTCLADLPASVTELADDAFPENCLVAIGGEMPGYVAKCTSIAEKKLTIDQNKAWVAELAVKLDAEKKDFTLFLESKPAEFNAIPELQKQKGEIQGEIQALTAKYHTNTQGITIQIDQAKQLADNLRLQKKKCFFLNCGKKEKLQALIDNETQKVSTLQETLKQSEEAFIQDSKRLTDQMTPIQAELEKMERKKNVWESTRQKNEKYLSDLQTQIDGVTSTITVMEYELSVEELKLASTHQQWLEDYASSKIQFEKDEKSRIAKEKKAEENEIKKIKRNLNKITISYLTAQEPKEDQTALNYVSEAASVDERFLNAEYEKTIINQRHIAYIHSFNSFVEKHSTEINQIQEFNQEIGIENDALTKHWGKKKIPQVPDIVLPERFTVLNNYFSKNNAWKETKNAACHLEYKCDKTLDSFFAGTKNIRFLAEDKLTVIFAPQILLFPYCVVLYEQQKALRLYTYDKVKVTVHSKEEEQQSTSIPAYGELIGTHYLHANADGSPNKRFKDNPLMQQVRYTTIEFIFDKKQSIIVPTDSHSVTESFYTAYNEYVTSLTTGDNKDVYDDVIAGKDLDAIQKRIQKIISAKEEAEKKKIKEAKEAAKRLEEQRLAEQVAAEARKKEIIERQRALNEERKREAEEQKRKLKELTTLFDDDFKAANVESDGSDSTAVDIQTLPFIVTGNKTISNTVFKITLKTLSIIEGELIVYFTDENKKIISNKKKVIVSAPDEELTLGFMLNSGTDYTAMKKCCMQVERQDEVIGTVAFTMNIAFAPDEF